MARTVRVGVLMLLFVILWWIGASANYQSRGGLAVAIIALILLWIIAAATAILAALSLYSPEHSSKVRFQSSRIAVRWNPSKSQILAYATASYGMTI